MEESFELQSSMSPKVKGHQKHFRKGTTLLALKKNIRRSSIYDKSSHTVQNAQLIIIEDSNSSESTQSNIQSKRISKSPIVISDTDCSDNENFENSHTLKKKLSETRRENSISNNDSLLSKSKLHDIERWIERVNVEAEVKSDTTMFSDVSTIDGDSLNVNFKPEGVGHSVNSTYMGRECVRFDKLFKNGSKTGSSPSGRIKKIDQSSSDIVIDDSFENLNESLNTRPKKTILIRKSHNECSTRTLNDCTSKSKFDVNSEVPETPKNIPRSQNIDVNDIKSTGSSSETDESQNDLQSMLDDLYGNSWREKKDHVLPKSEPRKKLPKPDLCIANSERKPKFSVLYKNPYMESEKVKSNTLLQHLQRSRLQVNNMESPWSKLKNLCDSDTHSEDSNKINFRKKLNFNNDSDGDDELSNGRKSKYFMHKLDEPCEVPLENNSNKENSQSDKDSYLGESLEERIRKKINKAYVPEKINKNKVHATKTVRKKKPLHENQLENVITGKLTGASVSNNSSSGKSVKTRNEINSDNKSPSVCSDDEWEKEIDRIKRESKMFVNKHSFLASLSANVPIMNCDIPVRMYRNHFRKHKDQLLDHLFTLYNEKVFDNSIPKDTEFEWNDRLRGTAGYCSCKKITRRTGVVERKVKIVLSTKVIDAAYRLRDTLIHELCHAATWIVNCVSDGHGTYWKAWACKAMKTFPELPPIKRCHDYVIKTKYTYKCTDCGYSIGRHSKSLDIERKRCGYCRGKFEILINKVSKKGENKSVPATPKREPTGFALFVKENYATYKSTQLKHGDIMKLLGQKFQEMKVK